MYFFFLLRAYSFNWKYILWHSVVFLHAFERKIQNINSKSKKYSAEPGNELLGITDAKEEIIMSNKNYFETEDRRVCP